jgi:hypothetical protein
LLRGEDLTGIAARRPTYRASCRNPWLPLGGVAVGGVAARIRLPSSITCCRSRSSTPHMVTVTHHLAPPTTSAAYDCASASAVGVTREDFFHAKQEDVLGTPCVGLHSRPGRGQPNKALRGRDQGGYKGRVRSRRVRKIIRFWHKCSPNCDFLYFIVLPPYPVPKTYDGVGRM